MSVVVYKDEDSNAIVLEDNGAQFLNTLQAIDVGSNINIHNTVENIDIVSNTPHTDFVDNTGTTYQQLDINQGGTGTTVEVCNLLNSIFQASGTPSSSVPVITSSTTINVTSGDTINYELIANFGVGYEWVNLPSGVATVDGNIRKIIGGSGLSVGTYTPTMKAINYNGEDSQTLTIIVASPPYSNTKSIKFNNNDFLNAPATTSNPFYRASNGSGSTDSWTVCGWFKGGTNNNSQQTLMSYGGNDKDNEGRVWIYWDGNSSKESLVLKYGSENNWLKLTTPNFSIDEGVWHHIIVTYDGGTTGSSSGSILAYYGRFEVWIDGVSQTTTNTESNYGWNGSIKDELFLRGEVTFGGKHLRNNCNEDEWALWGSDQTANVSSIYNSGTAHDLGLLATPPVHYWRDGDGDTYPTLQDSIGSLDFTMNNMTSADIVNDVP